MVASCREKKVMSMSVILFPPPRDCFLTFGLAIPCRRKVAVTMFIPDARISPLTCFPDLSLPSHEKTETFTPLESFADAAVVAMSYSLGSNMEIDDTTHL